MSVVMLGSEVANAMKEKMQKKAEELKKAQVFPMLAIVRVGCRPDDLAYERGATKRMETIGIGCRVYEFDESISQEELETEFSGINKDPEVHGILLFRPLPDHLDETPLKAMINPWKDVDGMSPVNMAKVFSGDESGFAPCTAEAVLQMLEHYNIELSGKKVTVVGRSMVVGRPLSMLMLKKNATVTVCHTKTADLAACCREAEVLVAAAGKARMVTGDMIGEGAVVADVGINVDEEGRLCGDVAFEEAEGKASYLSPVPRGVGSVTSSVLASHVLRSAEYLRDER